MSKEAQELAVEAVRRAEWALGRAIRKGQAEGQIGVPSPGVSSSVTGLPKPSDFASASELYPNPKQAGIYDLAEAEEHEFEEALTEAREEGNLSRANVVRKIESRYEGDDVESWIVSHNVHRRHLTTSQRSMIAARLATLRHGSNRFEQKVEGSFEPSTSTEVQVSALRAR